MESTTTWLLTLGILSLVIVFDLTLAIIRRNKETTMTEAGIWTVIYVAAAIVFGILCLTGPQIQMLKRSSLQVG